MAKLFQLPTLSDEFDRLTLKDALPELKPRFFIPPMLDKPQNPILETLKLRDPIVQVPTPPRLLLPTELASITLDSSPCNFPALRESIWTDAIKNGSSHSEILSWDSLRPNYSGRPSPNAFISEQENLVFAAARYYVQPRLNNPHIEIKYVTQQELLSALKMTVLGTFSPLHSWDPVTETFVQVVTQKGARGVLAVDDKDEVVSESWISGFLTIGTLMRRVEMVVASPSSRFAKEGPTIHAFTHAVSTILSYLREGLAQCPPEDEHSSITLAAAWVQYAPYKDILVALAALCCRDEHKSPQNYTVLDHNPEPLLSLLYDHLHSHLERQSPTRVTAVIAFILTSASREYFHQLSRSVGFGGDSMAKKPARVVGEQNDQYALDVSDDGQEEERDEFESVSESFPSFFPPDVVGILPAAQKSLVLLRAAEPDHPLLRAPPFQCTIEWFWTLNDIDMAWNQQRRQPESTQPAGIPQGISDAADSGLAQFRIFDLEPGGHFGHSLLDNKGAPTPIAALQDFLDAFPQTLHPITPTLAHLTTLVLEPLVKHASTLSSTLLSLFISPIGPLQFQRHLRLLHSYLLFASPSFKSRLSAALFSDSQGYDADEEIPTSVRSIGARRKTSEKQKGRPHRWPVGLSFALLERETWPPVGADLSFFLRTVIVDSFEIPDERMDEGDVPSTRDMFWVEAERRLGFAIRDLPTGPGHDQWLNPLSIEALDFLYMDYKAPHPLDILITPDTLSKYHRMFAYLLRIIRVEHALAAVFRMCRGAARPLFPTLTSSSKLLLHFRFIAHSFVTRLSEYVFNYAIGGNFDPFVASLLSEGSQGGAAYPDVFALSRAHSALMDDVLSACLLRSSQRSAGDLLRQALEIVLEFAVLVGDLKTGKLEEYQAAPLLADLASSFKSKMLALTRSLKSILDKGSSVMEHNHKPSDARKPTGGLSAVAHLLESLSEWWSN